MKKHILSGFLPAEDRQRPWNGTLRACVLDVSLSFALAKTLQIDTGAFFGGAALGLAVIAALCCLSGRKWGNGALAAIPAAVLILCILFSEETANSLRCCLNGWLNNRTVATGILHLPLEAGETSSLYGWLLLCAVCAAVVTLLVKNTGIVPQLLFALLGTAAVLLLPGETGTVSGFALFLGSAGALACTAAGHHRGRDLRPALALLLTAAVTLGSGMLLPGEGLLREQNRKVEVLLHKKLYERAGSALSEGELLRTRDTGDTIRLTVQMEQAEPLYLRGFVGCDYTGQRWTALENSVLAVNADTLYWLKRTGFDPRFQTAAAAETLQQQVPTAANTVTVRNIAECGRYAYVPYGAKAMAQDALSLREDTVTQDRNASAQYTFQTVYLPGTWISQWVDALNETDNANYRNAADSYQRFAEENYLAVPDSVRSELTPLLESARAILGISGKLTKQDAIECINVMLESCLSYDKKADIPAENADYVHAALAGGKGNDETYATVTVLALRCYGIAARYAEGYAVTQRQAEDAVESPLSLTDSAAHAWAEIYQEGVGWIPLELTPGYASGMGSAARTARADLTDGTGVISVSGSAPLKEGEEYEPRDLNPENETDPEARNRQQKDVFRLLGRILLIAAACLLFLFALFALLLVFRRKKALEKRKRLFENDNTADAVSWQFAYAVKLLAASQVEPGSGSTETMLPRVESLFGAGYAASFGEMLQLNREALFSTHPIGDDSLTGMERFAADTLRRVLETRKLRSRLKMKWIQCLY